MAKKKKTWISLDEAVELLMQQRKGLTRDQAIDILGTGIQGKKVKARKVDLGPFGRLMSGEDAARAFAEKSESAFMPLGYFIGLFHFSPRDIIPELTSGRLNAPPANSTARLMRAMDEPIPADAFVVTAKAMHEWIHHPQTPRHFIEQICEAMKASDFGERIHPTGVTFRFEANRQ